MRFDLVTCSKEKLKILVFTRIFISVDFTCITVSRLFETEVRLVQTGTPKMLL